MIRQNPLSGVSAQPASGISEESERRTLRSLDRFSNKSRNISNPSLRLAMSLEKSERSVDIYDQWLEARKSKKAKESSCRMSIQEEEQPESSMVAEEPKVRSAFEPVDDGEVELLKRKSVAVQYSLNESVGVDLSKIRCTCTKIGCQKGYCQCFRVGLKCGRFCSCKDCKNWGREESMEVPQPYLEEVDPDVQLPQELQFEDFKYNRYSLEFSRGF